MPPTDTYPLADRILKYKLAEFLTEARANGQSYRVIAQRLADEHGYVVTAETLRTWCHRIKADA